MASINMIDFPDSGSNSKYKQEIEKLSQQIAASMKAIDCNENGLVSQEELLTFLQGRVPPGKPLDIPLFQKFFKSIDTNGDGQLDIKEFTNEYIRNNETLKMSLETFRSQLEIEKSKRAEYERKKLEMKNEKLNIEGLCSDAYITVELGTLNQENSYLQGFNECFFELSLDNNKSQKTSTHSLNDMHFNEKLKFKVDSLKQVLVINFYNKNDHLYMREIPLNMISANLEMTLDFDIPDLNGNSVLFTFNPTFLLMTSSYQLYQNLYDQSVSNIQSYQDKIDKLSVNYDALSAPFRSMLMDVSYQGKTIGNSAFENKVLDQVENILKSTLKQQDIKWATVLKYVLYITIATALITTFTKPDFFSLFIEMIMLIIINTGMMQTLFDHFWIFLGMVLCSIAYDLIDYFCLRTADFKSMKTINSVVALFALIGFVGKLIALICVWIHKIKFSKTGVVH